VEGGILDCLLFRELFGVIGHLSERFVESA
jgi:hypothetical protein